MRKVIAATLASLVVVAALVGCSGTPAPEPVTAPSKIGGSSDSVRIDVDGRKVTCIVWQAYRAGGISCDWARKLGDPFDITPHADCCDDDLPPGSSVLAGDALAVHTAAFPKGKAPGACLPGCPCRARMDPFTDALRVLGPEAFAIPADAKLTAEQAARIWDKVQAAMAEDRAAGRDPVLDEVPVQRQPGERGGNAVYPPFNPGGGGRS